MSLPSIRRALRSRKTNKGTSCPEKGQKKPKKQVIKRQSKKYREKLKTDPKCKHKLDKIKGKKEN